MFQHEPFEEVTNEAKEGRKEGRKQPFPCTYGCKFRGTREAVSNGMNAGHGRLFTNSGVQARPNDFAISVELAQRKADPTRITKDENTTVEQRAPT